MHMQVLEWTNYVQVLDFKYRRCCLVWQNIIEQLHDGLLPKKEVVIKKL